jgi:hypothetical protein
MKRVILCGLAALALAAPAIAQPPAVPIASDFEGGTSTPTAYEQLDRHGAEAAPNILRSVQKASSELQLACAADREKLCADAKTTFSAGRCLEHHRKDLNTACRAALSQAAMAWSGPQAWNDPH